MPPWIVSVGKNEFIFNQPTFSQVVDDVVKHFASLLAPFQLTNDVIAFEGRCFSLPGSPSVTVLNEDSYIAFLDAARKFIPGQLPRVSLVDLRTGAPPSVSTPLPKPGGSIASSSLSSSAAGASSPPPPTSVAGGATILPSTPSVVASRLKNIQRVYEGLASGGGGGGDEDEEASALSSSMAVKQLSPTRRKAAASNASTKKATRPTDEVTFGDSVDLADSQPIISASSLRAQMQRELELAEKELCELEHARATAAGARREGLLSQDGATPSSSTRGNQAVVTSPGPQLMVWGTTVARGEAIPFSFSERLTLATLTQRCATALQQNVTKLSYHTETAAPEVDLEDDSDVEVLRSVLAAEGIEHVTLTAYGGDGECDGYHLPSHTSGSQHTASAASATAASGLVSQAKLRREVRQGAHLATAAGGGATSFGPVTTPVTSPIKSVHAPSPFRNAATVATGAVRLQSSQRPPPSRNLIGSLD